MSAETVATLELTSEERDALERLLCSVSFYIAYGSVLRFADALSEGRVNVLLDVERRLRSRSTGASHAR